MMATTEQGANFQNPAHDILEQTSAIYSTVIDYCRVHCCHESISLHLYTVTFGTHHATCRLLQYKTGSYNVQ